jgi:hypothetical protein
MNQFVVKWFLLDKVRWNVRRASQHFSAGTIPTEIQGPKVDSWNRGIVESWNRGMLQTQISHQ